MRYLKVMLLLVPALLAGCTTLGIGTAATSSATTAAQSQAQLQASWLQECLLYEAAQKALYLNLNKLSNAQLQQALMVTSEITPLCLSQPANLQAATVQITSAITTIGILAAVNASGAVK